MHPSRLISGAWQILPTVTKGKNKISIRSSIEEQKKASKEERRLSGKLSFRRATGEFNLLFTRLPAGRMKRMVQKSDEFSAPTPQCDCRPFPPSESQPLFR